jgi:hypothetical protein
MWRVGCSDLFAGGCSATVNDYEACWQADIDAYSAAYAAITCELAGTAGATELVEPPVPAICSMASGRCSELDDGVFERGGGDCSGCSPYADCTFGSCACRAGYEGNGLTCVPAGSYVDGDLRLVGGPDVWEGRLEVYHDGRWGTVCDDSFGSPDGQVACRQLGALGFQSLTDGSGYDGSAESQTIWLDDLNCSGDESRLVSCSHAGLGNENCSHSEDVGLRCEPPLPPLECDGMTVVVYSEASVQVPAPGGSAVFTIRNPGPGYVFAGYGCGGDPLSGECTERIEVGPGGSGSLGPVFSPALMAEIEIQAEPDVEPQEVCVEIVSAP